MTPKLSEMISRLTHDYLHPNNISVRQFSKATGVQRIRLSRLLSGKEPATIEEFVKINDGMALLNAKRKRLHRMLSVSNVNM